MQNHATTDDDRTDRPTTDDTDTDGVPLLSAVVTAREILQDVDPATVDDAQESRLINALEALDNVYIEASPEEIADALDVDADEIGDDTLRHRRNSECPAVPVYFQVPPAAADRAIDRFNHRRENGRPVRAGGADLEEYIYDEIDQRHRVYVGDETLAEYAEDRVESLTLEADDVDAEGDRDADDLEGDE